MFSGGLRPHYYCLPVAKREQHRKALVAAACSGDEHFFLGTDSAPHARDDKESACGCAGIYSSAVAMETYLEVFAAADALDALRAFACENGPRFYHLPVNTDAVVYERCASPPVPPRHDGIEVFEPPMPLYWRRRDP